MKKLLPPVGLAFTLALMFVWGMTGGGTLPALISFCGWTPAMVFLGYRIARTGLHIHVSAAAYTPARPQESEEATLARAQQIVNERRARKDGAVTRSIQEFN